MAGLSSSAAVPPPADGTKRITIGGNVQQASWSCAAPGISSARQAGTHLRSRSPHAIIGKEGNVINLSVISATPAHPLGPRSCQQWVLQKTLLNGEPVEVSTQIDVNYTLSDSPPVEQ
jgi:protein TonB